jgi:hypothetical protein
MAALWNREPLVRYVSPFGYPAWMTRRRAEQRMARDGRRWQRYDTVGCLTPREREVGPPHIDPVPICDWCGGSGVPTRAGDAGTAHGTSCSRCLGAGYLADKWPPSNGRA